MRGPVVPPVLRHGSLPWLLAVSFAGFLFADILAFYRVLPGFCGALTLGTVATLTEASLHANGATDLLSGWAIMLLAMMPPLVSAPVNHVLASSLPRRRLRSVSVMLVGYGALWLMAGLVFVPLAVATMLALHAAAFPVALFLAVVWSCSPLAQVARNRCHRLIRIGLRGWRADRDCVRQGAAVAPWCILSCSPWMLAAMVAGTWHVAAMVAVTIYLLTDRILPPASVRWRAPAVSGYVWLALRA
ncbi:MAG: rane protein [Bradyrhizobium sp.]|nr:rane protein [Bradyrhizobium sp.]